MKNWNLNRRQKFILNWSPLLAGLSLLWLILSLLHGPIFVRYLIACAGLGLFYGACVVLDYWKRLLVLPALGWGDPHLRRKACKKFFHWRHC
jgi:hypothetical protein